MIARHRIAHFFCWLFAIAVIGGCGRRGAPGDETVTKGAVTVPGQRSSWLPKREARKTDSINLEGATEKLEMTLFDPGLLFSTYYPSDMVAERLPAEDGAKVRFHANFGGVENKDVYMEIFLLKEAGELMDMKSRILGGDGMMATNGWQVEPAHATVGDLCPWAHESYSFVDPRVRPAATVQVCVGLHKDRPFYVILHYPMEYSEGFAPRAGLILRNIRWEDNGDPLRRQ